MARPAKQGMDYFPYDCDLDQDDKLGMIIGEYEHKGERAYTKLLCWIYKHEGYFTSWKEDVQLRFMRRYSYCGFSLGFINEVVQRCIKWGLFDKALFESFQILTSSRIQETWLDATRKRTGRVYIPKYWLIEVSTALKPEETEYLPEVIDKEKESTVNQIKENEIVAPAAPALANLIADENLKIITPERRNAGRKKFEPPSIEQAKEFFLKTIGNKKKPGHWPPDKCENEAGKYFNHYMANGWKQGKGKPIVDWEASARNWITNEREGTFSAPSYSVQQKAAGPPVDAKPVLSKGEVEVNYLFELFCEDPAKVTVISIDPGHYNLIKTAGMISFSEAATNEIKALSDLYIKEKKIQVNDQVKLKYMKKFGVLEFFKSYAKLGKDQVFYI